MRVAKLWVVALLSVMLLAGCGSSGKTASTNTTVSTSHKLSVVVTTTQLADFVSTIGGSHVSVYDMVKTGVDPHSYTPTSADVSAIATADLLIRNGAGLDAWFDKALKNDSHKATVVDASVGVTLLPSKDPNSPLGDPHIWNSIVDAKQMVANVRSALATADAVDADEFASTERGYDSQLDALVSDASQSFGSLGNKVLVTDHEAYDYFCAEFSLTCAGSITPTSGAASTPTSAQITAVANSLAGAGALAVFAEATASPAPAEELATDLGVKVEEGSDGLYGDSLGAPGGDGDTYLKMERHNLDIIVKNLH